MSRNPAVAGDIATITRWAKKLRANVIYDVPVINPGGARGPRANSASREVHAINPEESPESFWSTMHELGHIAHKHVGSAVALLFGLTDPKEPEREAEAWVWAIDHANRPLDLDGRTDIQFALASYLYRNEPREVGDPDPVIGPNLRRLFAEIGPEFDTAAAEKLFPSPSQRERVPDAKRIWQRYAKQYGDIKLAA